MDQAKEHIRVGKIYGYGRISRRTQREDRQVAELENHCDEIVIEKISADSDIRPKFDALLKKLQANDTFLVLDLDRAFRDMVDAILVLHDLRQRGVHFKILNCHLDLTTRSGRLMYVLKAHQAEEELATIRRRTREGLAAARKRGVKLGRPFALTDAQIRRAHVRIISGDAPAYKVARRLRVSAATLKSGIERLGLCA